MIERDHVCPLNRRRNLYLLGHSRLINGSNQPCSRKMMFSTADCNAPQQQIRLLRGQCNNILPLYIRKTGNQASLHLHRKQTVYESFLLRRAGKIRQASHVFTHTDTIQMMRPAKSILHLLHLLPIKIRCFPRCCRFLILKIVS